MRFGRRRFLGACAVSLAGASLPKFAKASAYPTRPIRILVGFPPGGGPDILARLLGQHLSERFGQGVIVDNRPGAASSIALEAAAHSTPDGYTLIMLVGTNIFNMATNPNLRVNLLRDIEPVASIADAPYVLMVNRSVPARSVAEFIAYAKARPGAINMATGSKGSGGHVFGLFFNMLAGIDVVHVFYRGNYMNDLVAGQVQAAIVPTPQGIPYHRSGDVRILGVSTPQRLGLLPDIATIAETLPGYDALGWYGLGGPRGLPSSIVELLNGAITDAIRDEKFKTHFEGMGIQPLALSPAAFGQFMAKEYEKWSRVVRDSGIKMD